MNPRSFVSKVFTNVAYEKSALKHPAEDIAVVTERYGDMLWTVSLFEREHVTRIDAYPATDIGHAMHEFVPGSGDVQKPARALLNEVVENIKAEPYVLAANDEHFSIPDERSELAGLYATMLSSRQAIGGLSDRDFARTLEDTLTRYGSAMSSPDTDRLLRYAN